MHFMWQAINSQVTDDKFHKHFTSVAYSSKKISDLLRANGASTVSEHFTHYPKRRYDIQYNDTKHDNIQHNDPKHNNIQHNDTKHNNVQHNDTKHNNIQHK